MLRVSGLRWRTTSCALLATLALAGCGQQDGGGTPEASSSAGGSPSAATGKPAPPGTPECGEVWKAGAHIPRTYHGCTEEGGGYVARDVLGCSSGQRMVRYADRFWGVLGGTVNEASADSLDEDRDYETSMRNCSA